MKFLREGSMSDVYYTFQDIANNPDYSDIDAIAQIKKVMSQPTDDAEQFVARKLKLMHDTIAKHPSYKNDPMGVYEEMLDMIRTEYHDETYESKEMNPTTQTFSEDNDTNSLEQWKADVRKQYPQQASQIKFKGKGFGDTIVAEIPGKDQAFGEFNMETGDAWVAPMDEGVAEGSMPYPHGKPEAGDKITWYHSNNYPKIEGTVVGRKDGHLIVQSVDPSPRNTEKTVAKYRVPKNNILSVEQQGVAEALDKEGDYHVSVQKGKFLPSDRGGGSDENLNYLHDLMNISGTGGGPMLVTISDPRIATEVAAMYGGKVLKTRYGTYRIVQSKGQNQKTPTPEPELVGMREDGVAEALDPDTQRLEQEVRDALANGDDYTAKSLVKMAQTAADRNYLRKIIRQEMYGTGPGQGGIMEGDDRQVVFSGTGANGGKYKIIQTGPTDFMIHANGKHIDTYSSLQRAISVLKNEVPGLKKGVAEGASENAWNAGTSDEDFIRKFGKSEFDRLTKKYGVSSIPVQDLLGYRAKEPTDPKVRLHRGLDGMGAKLKSIIKHQGVEEGNYPNYPKEPDLDQDKRDFKRQELQHELGHERNNYAVVIDGRTWKVFADQRKAQNIARSLKSRGKNASVQETGASPTSESVGSGTGSTRRVSEDSAQGTANKQAWDKGHEAGYTGNEKCPCKPGSAEEKAWNAGHKVGRDERSHERHGVKEGNMKSSANNPTGPSFAGGKWKGTDSADQAKNKYVGEISEGTMPSVKLMRNIAEGLVRVDDLVLNRPVYGKPTDQDRRAVYRMVREFADAGIDYNDAVVELVEYFKHELSELAVAPTIPAVGGKPAIVAPTGTSVGSTTPPTANTAATTPGTVSSTAPGAAPVVAPPVTQQGVDALAQMVKNAGLSPSQISTLMSKAK